MCARLHWQQKRPARARRVILGNSGVSRDKHAPMDQTWQKRRAALVVAHPGHELRVHGWLEKARPMVFVLTDGSGRTHRSRLDSTTSVLRAANCDRGSIYGRWTDRSVYEALQHGNARPFVDVARELAAALVTANIKYVVADAAEGYNPTHDICRCVVDAAVQFARQRIGPIETYEFLLVGRPDYCPEPARDGAIRIALDSPALDRKTAAADNYAELRAEVDAALQQFGKAVFATEYLIPVTPAAGLAKFRNSTPYYERYGEQQVAAGHYRDVIRYSQHVEPIVDAIWHELRLSAAVGFRRS